MSTLTIIGFQGEKHVIDTSHLYFLHVEDYYGATGYLWLDDGHNRITQSSTQAAKFHGSSINPYTFKDSLVEFLRFNFVQVCTPTQAELIAAFGKFDSENIPDSYFNELDKRLILTEAKCNKESKLTESTDEQLHKRFTM